MRPLHLRLTAAALAVASALTSFTSAQALQMPSAPAISAASAVTDVQYRDRRDWRRDRYGWHRGYRGYRDRRPGYRYYNGFWFPLAAFGTGVIIGGAIANDRGPYSGRHVAWCESRYRSYRASDNTYVPRAGVRARCVSPYR
ncbi:BA14K family protein [Neorhizobium sp. DT-125]|uniref:BA14K family protein n=1 Tax=Neorhizobium sp. DT-125 TaxID=3396163 RepID=UPI003F1B15F9